MSLLGQRGDNVGGYVVSPHNCLFANHCMPAYLQMKPLSFFIIIIFFNFHSMQTDRPTAKVSIVSRVTRISKRAPRPGTQKPGDWGDVGGIGNQVRWLLAGCDQADNKEINKSPQPSLLYSIAEGF